MKTMWRAQVVEEVDLLFLQVNLDDLSKDGWSIRLLVPFEKRLLIVASKDVPS